MTDRGPIPTRWQHSTETWEKRTFFTSEFEEACRVKGIEVKWLDDEKWTGLMESSGDASLLYGYDLGLNPSASAKIADSKADTYRALQLSGIPAVRHERLSPNLTDGTRLGSAALKAMAIDLVGLPLVAKPDALASGGKGVTLCHDEDDVLRAVSYLTEGGVPVAVSPYIDFTEYRAVVLGGEARAVIEKTKQPGGWMHNHSQGAEHRMLAPTSDLHQEMGALGVRAAAALGMNFTTVDIARTDEGSAVLELNDAVSIVYPHDTDLRAASRRIYGDAAQMRLANS